MLAGHFLFEADGTEFFRKLSHNHNSYVPLQRYSVGKPAKHINSEADVPQGRGLVSKSDTGMITAMPAKLTGSFLVIIAP